MDDRFIDDRPETTVDVIDIAGRVCMLDVAVGDKLVEVRQYREGRRD